MNILRARMQGSVHFLQVCTKDPGHLFHRGWPEIVVIVFNIETNFFGKLKLRKLKANVIRLEKYMTKYFYALTF